MPAFDNEEPPRPSALGSRQVVDLTHTRTHTTGKYQAHAWKMACIETPMQCEGVRVRRVRTVICKMADEIHGCAVLHCYGQIRKCRLVWAKSWSNHPGVTRKISKSGRGQMRESLAAGRRLTGQYERLDGL